ncbi:MAG: hypothetical protein IJC43_02645, partial [Clostridia bacterium]|nr:hypothetical protein [Clostridia bacterium]
KYKTAYKYLIIYYFITMLPLVIGVDISSVSDMTLLGSYTQQALFIFFMRKIPDMFPEAWDRSMFHMPRPVFNTVMWICFAGAVMNVWGQITNSSATTLAVNVAVMVVGVVFSLTWYKSGKVHASQSWEIENGQ